MFRRHSLPFRSVLSGVFASCRAMSSSSVNTASSPCIVAVAQLQSTSNKLTNLIDIAKCAGWAKRDGACMLFLPENFGMFGDSTEQTLEQAEPPLTDDARENPSSVSQLLRETIRASSGGDDTPSSDKSVDFISLLEGIKTIAGESNVWISGGGMHVSGAPPADQSAIPRVYNTHIVVDNEGTLKCFYRKAHLFDVSIPGKVNLRESTTTAPGTELVMCDSPIGSLGLTICYDLRFPEMYLELTKRGAHILLVPSAFTAPTGSAHWHILLRARAIETQCYVIAAAQFGQHNAKRQSYGHSLVVDPWGAILADAGGCDGPGTLSNDAPTAVSTPSIITCPIDLELVASVRKRMPVQLHRESSSFS